MFQFFIRHMNRKSYCRLIVIAIGLVVVSGLFLPPLHGTRPRLRAIHIHPVNYVDSVSLPLTITINTNALTNQQSQMP